jgi:formylglycine-generating enzyme required for sulfatase activity
MLLTLTLPAGEHALARPSDWAAGLLAGSLPALQQMNALADPVPVDITEGGLEPTTASAEVGQTVEWTNQTDVTVRLIAGGAFRVYLPAVMRAITGSPSDQALLASVSAPASPQEWGDVEIPAGGTHTHVFTEPGTYPYYVEFGSRQAGAEPGAARYPLLAPSGTSGEVEVRPQETVTVPAGEFIMGCYGGSQWESCNPDDEWPTHAVYLDAFYIDKYEVTNAQYAQCVAEGGCEPHSCTGSRTRTSYYCNSEFANYPMVMVDWEEAAAYCAWAGKRLPTEAEWEKAARGTDRRAFPWGNSEPECWKANFVVDPPAMCEGDTTEVGSYPYYASPYGALDMAGNVAEWVYDWYDAEYYEDSPYSNPQGPAGEFQDPYTTKVTRGGQFDFIYLAANTSDRDDEYYHGGWYTLGFRCASSAGP